MTDRLTPGATIGILGGGQLGRIAAHEILQPLGLGGIARAAGHQAAAVFQAEAAGLEQGRQALGHMGVSAIVPPVLHAAANEAIQPSSPGIEREAIPLPVFVQDQGAPRPEGPGDQIQQGIEVFQKHGHPAAPGPIPLALPQAMGGGGLVQIQCQGVELLEVALARLGLKVLQVGTGVVDGQHPSRGAHQLGQVQAGKARSAAQVQQPLARSPAGLLPGSQAVIAPDGVLALQAIPLPVVAAQHVAGAFAGRRHWGWRARGCSSPSKTRGKGLPAVVPVAWRANSSKRSCTASTASAGMAFH